MSPSRRLCGGIVAGLALLGCAPALRGPTHDEAAPVITVAPGYAERIALMDRYRLHDEDRKRMMARPHVWVEELPEDEASPDTDASEGPDDDASAGEDAHTSDGSR